MNTFILDLFHEWIDTMPAIATIPIAPDAEDRSPLNAVERAYKKELETDATYHQESFEKFCRIMSEIREKRLYREGWSNFHRYLEERWGIKSEDTVSTLRSIRKYETLKVLEGSTTVLPKTEARMRPLHGLPDDEKVEVWERAVELADGDQPSVAQVYEAAREHAPERFTQKRKTKQPKTLADVDLAKAAGIIPAGAVVEIIEGDAIDDDGLRYPEDSALSEDDLSDSEWLLRPEITRITSQLGPLPCERFKSEAIAFRKTTPARLALIAAVKPILDRVKREHNGYIGPWMYHYYDFAKINGPERWVPCAACDGGGQLTLIGACDACRGRGYHV